MKNPPLGGFSNIYVITVRLAKKPAVQFLHQKVAGESMFDLKAFQNLCHRAAVETDPAELEVVKDALRIMLRFEGVEVEPAGKNIKLKPN